MRYRNSAVQLSEELNKYVSWKLWYNVRSLMLKLCSYSKAAALGFDWVVASLQLGIVRLFVLFFSRCHMLWLHPAMDTGALADVPPFCPIMFPVCFVLLCVSVSVWFCVVRALMGTGELAAWHTLPSLSQRIFFLFCSSQTSAVVLSKLRSAQVGQIDSHTVWKLVRFQLNSVPHAAFKWNWADGRQPLIVSPRACCSGVSVASLWSHCHWT